MSRIPDDTLPTGTTAGAPQVLLSHHLKQPTVLREYETVARECARDGVDPPRYLLRLIELELIDRERRTVEARIRAARFPVVKSNWLSNRIFTSYDNIVDHCCEAWNNLVDQPWHIMTIGRRKWARGS